MTNVQKYLTELLEIIQKADAAIMKIYNARSAIVTTKSDSSPVTQADIASHEILIAGITKLFPSIPILSEEGNEQENRKTVKLKQFWLVDPLDGTKDFLSRTGDFTVCLALIEEDLPVFGIISAPAHGVVYYGGPGMGSYKMQAGKPGKPMHVSKTKRQVVLASISHPNKNNANYIAEHYAGYKIQQVGSQLKLPYIAEGKADAYPRIDSSMYLWDLAAGHAILVGAGGRVSRPDNSPIDYHNATLHVGDFLATSEK